MKEKIRKQSEEQAKAAAERKKRQNDLLLQRQQRELKGIEGTSGELGKKEVDPHIYNMYFDVCFWWILG